MPLPRFSFEVARSVEEALDLWARSPGAGYFAGGTDLLPQLRVGRRRLDMLIDIKRIPGLDEIRVADDGGVTIGATVPLTDIQRHTVVRERYPLLVECCRRVGAWPLQNRATMAGNVCNASPAGDTTVALLALDATIVAVSQNGRRSIPVAELFLGPGQTALVPGELVTEIVLPASAVGLAGSYLRLSRRQGMDLATIGVLVGRGNWYGQIRYRIALAAVAPTPLRVYEAESILASEGASVAARAAEVARIAARPITDLRGSAEYRREMVGVLVSRGLAALDAPGVRNTSGWAAGVNAKTRDVGISS